MSNENLFPTPGGAHFLMGHLPEFRKNHITFYEKAWRDFGDFVVLKAPLGVKWYLSVHPEAAHQLLVSDQESYSKPPYFKSALRLVIGDALLASEGATWKFHRRTLNPLFTRHGVLEFSNTIQQHLGHWVGALKKKGAQLTDAEELFVPVTMNIAGTAFLSQSLGDDASRMGHAFRSCITYVNYRMTRPVHLPTWWPRQREREFRQNSKILFDFVNEVIKRRRAGAESAKDLLSLMMEAMDKDTGRKFSDLEVRDEILGMLQAGHDTLASSLTFAAYLLAKNPKIQDDCYDELKTLRGEIAHPKNLEELPLLNAIFKETIRLYPPAWAVTRITNRECTLLGRRLKKGSVVNQVQFLTHRHPDFWEAPEEFRPTRFMSEARLSHKYAYYPFSAGPRSCIGAHFATLEACMILTTLLQNFRITLGDEKPLRLDPTFALKPLDPIHFSLVPRS